MMPRTLDPMQIIAPAGVVGYCETCESVVLAIQDWKISRRGGRLHRACKDHGAAVSA